MKAQIISAICLITFAFVNTSCENKVVFVLYNDTGHNITVVCYDSSKHATAYSIDNQRFGSIAMLNSWHITFDATLWVYDKFPLLDRHYVASKALEQDKDYFQVEPNGDIYNLLPNTKAVVKSLPPQPKGFPVKPSVKDSQ